MILDLDAEAIEEAVVTQIVDGRLVGGEVEGGDLGAGGLIAERALGPLPDQLTGLEIVGREVGVSRRDRVERSVERDDEDAGVTRLLHRRHDRRGIAWDQQDALGAGGDQLLNRPHLAIVVAVELAGERLRRQAELLGLGVEAFFHFDKEGIGVGFRDKPDDIAGMGRRAHKGERQRGSRDGCEQSRHLGHRFPPDESMWRRRLSRPKAAGRNVLPPVTVSRRRISIGQTSCEESRIITSA